MRALIVNSSITHGLLLILPILCALLLKRARCPGWAVVGGVAAGVLLGPAVLGRVVPAEYEAHFIGGVAEREALTELEQRQGADRRAAEAARRDPAAWAELEQRHRAERREPEQALAEARWSFQRPFRSYTSAMAVLALLASGVLRIRSTPAPHALAATASVGIASAVVPGIIALATGRAWFELDWPAALLFGAAVAVGPWAIRRGDQMSADEAEQGGAHMLQTAGRIAFVIGAGAAAAAFSMHLGWPRALWLLPLIAAPIGWLLPPLPDTASTARTVIEATVLPSIAACAVLRSEVLLETDLWLALLVIVLSGDGRWLGAFLGAMALAERAGGRTMRLVLGAMAAGPTQLVVAAIGVHAGVIGGRTAWALVLGALAVEVTASARRRVAVTMAQAPEP